MTRFRFVAEQAAQFPVSLLCRTLGVTRGGYYAWRRRPPSARAVADRELSERISEIHDQTLGIYGAPRVHVELRLAHGIHVGRKRVARLMRGLGIFGAGRQGGPRTATCDPARPSAPDLVDRSFCPRRTEPPGSATSSTCRPARGSCSSPRCRTSSAAGSSAGRCAMTCGQNWCSTPSGWPSHNADRAPAWSRTPTTAPSKPASPTAPTPRPPGTTSQWARSVTPGTTPSPRTSSPAPTRNSVGASASPPVRAARMRLFWSSSASTTPAAATPASAT